MILKGSCLCGAITIEAEGQPTKKVACHCRPCQKISGASAGLDLVYPKNSVKLTKGTPAIFARTGASGKELRYLFCNACSAMLWVEIDSIPDIKVVKYGTIDDYEYLDQAKPEVEMFTKNRYSWMPDVGGALQKVEG